MTDKRRSSVEHTAEGAAGVLKEEAALCGALAQTLRAQADARRRYAERCREASEADPEPLRVPMWDTERAVALEEARLLDQEAEAKETRQERLVVHASLLAGRWGYARCS